VLAALIADRTIRQEHDQFRAYDDATMPSPRLREPE
jgi:hypothetical protein